MTIQHLVIFFVPPEEIVNGGIMSIFSICKESRPYIGEGAISALSVFPGAKSYKKNRLFKNNEYVYEFSEILKKYSRIKSMQLHIPEYAVKIIAKNLPNYIPSGIDVSINILNQNIDYMPNISDFSDLLLTSTKITQTTAHAKYATQYISSKYATPVLYLSVFIDKQQYEISTYSEKNNVILYSPDGNEYKQRIVDKLRNNLPNYDIREINNLTYSEYKHAIRSARYVLTFGEGLDGYLIESCFSGAVAMTVYNERFFPNEDFLKIDGIYKDYNDMLANIVTMINSMDSNNKKYIDQQSKLESLLEGIYNKNTYIKNLERFFLNKFDFMPLKNDRDVFIANVISEKNRLLVSWEDANSQKDIEIENLRKSKSEYEQLYKNSQNELNNIYSSLFWKLSKPIHKKFNSTTKPKNRQT